MNGPLERSRSANIEAWRVHVLAGGGEMLEQDTTFTGFTGAPRAMWNPTIALADGFSDALDALEKEYVARGKQFGFLVDERFAEEGAEAAKRMGLRANEPPQPVMVLHPIPGGLEANGDVRRVIDAEAIEQHVLVQAAGFDNDPAELRAFMPAQVVASAERFYLGYADGVPAATAVMVPTPPDAGIFAVSTDPAYRRRGLGRAVTVAGVRDAAAAGCDLVYLQASEMGYPLYEALGFRTVELYRTFVRRPGEPAP